MYRSHPPTSQLRDVVKSRSESFGRAIKFPPELPHVRSSQSVYFNARRSIFPHSATRYEREIRWMANNSRAYIFAESLKKHAFRSRFRQASFSSCRGGSPIGRAAIDRWQSRESRILFREIARALANRLRRACCVKPEEKLTEKLQRAIEFVDSEKARI